MIYKTIAKCPHCGQEHEVEVEVLKPIEELTTDELKHVISAENSVRNACEKSGEEFTNADKFKAYKREYKRRQALAMLESLDEE